MLAPARLNAPGPSAVRDWLQAHPTIGGLFIAPVAANFKAPRADTVNQLRATILGLTP